MYMMILITLHLMYITFRNSLNSAKKKSRPNKERLFFYLCKKATSEVLPAKPRRRDARHREK